MRTLSDALLERGMVTEDQVKRAEAMKHKTVQKYNFEPEVLKGEARMNFYKERGLNAKQENAVPRC
jgi:hypothetical protein